MFRRLTFGTAISAVLAAIFAPSAPGALEYHCAKPGECTGGALCTGDIATRAGCTVTCLVGTSEPGVYVPNGESCTCPEYVPPPPPPPPPPPGGGGGDGGSDNDNPGCMECGSPIVLHSLPGLPPFSDADHGVVFDIFNDRMPLFTAWPTEPRTTAWLALDRNQNGRIDNGGELFGTGTRLKTGILAAHGYEALAELDANSDGWIDLADPAWHRLRLWRDLDRDGRSKPSELSPLRSMGVLRMATRATFSDETDQWGNEFRYRARIVTTNREIRYSWDVFVRVAPLE